MICDGDAAAAAASEGAGAGGGWGQLQRCCTLWCAPVRSLHRQLLRIKSAQAASAVGTFV